MEYFNYDIKNYKLHIINTDRFKTISLSINIRFDDENGDEKYFSLLSRLLLNTSYKYKTKRDINIGCAKIYDPTYSVNVLVSGMENMLTLRANFCNEKYTEKGMNEESIKYLLDILFKPKIINDGFDEKVFNIQKKKVIENLNSIRDYPNDYASARVDEIMQIKDYKEKSIAQLIKSISELTPQDLYKFYLKVLNKGSLDITLCGNVNPLEIKDIFERNVSFPGKYVDRNHICHQKLFNDKPNIIIEKSNNTQSNLIVGCKFDALTDFERNYVFILFSWILGGGVNSLLNQTVREKNSLCYYIYTLKYHLFDVIRIISGIDGENFDKTYNLILKEIENMKKGKFSLELFNSVKQIYYNSLIEIEDCNDWLVENFNAYLFIGCDKLEDRKKMMEKVTRQDVINLANKIHIDTVYLLEGEGNGEA